MTEDRRGNMDGRRHAYRRTADVSKQDASYTGPERRVRDRRDGAGRRAVR